MKLSANLGFLWQELPLTEAIQAAKAAGFDAVECHWPYAIAASEIRSALSKTGLDMLSLNTHPGDRKAADMGLTAIPARQKEARAAIDQAISYASEINALHVHVMAGVASGPEARRVFVENLRYAADVAAGEGKSLLIEPINQRDVPGYFLSTTTQACEIIEQVGADNLKLMFDCYHVQIMEGDVSKRLQQLLPVIGHIQMASVPARSEPDQGELNYTHVLQHLTGLGYTGYIGAEYKPATQTDAGLNWMAKFAEL